MLVELQLQLLQMFGNKYVEFQFVKVRVFKIVLKAISLRFFLRFSKSCFYTIVQKLGWSHVCRIVLNIKMKSKPNYLTFEIVIMVAVCRYLIIMSCAECLHEIEQGQLTIFLDYQLNEIMFVSIKQLQLVLVYGMYYQVLRRVGCTSISYVILTIWQYYCNRLNGINSTPKLNCFCSWLIVKRVLRVLGNQDVYLGNGVQVLAQGQWE
eukprot:TRINITY_DN3264_c0_g1_i14.p3 TRINITY_DN3264_c0_g1~~TRINITY_DN3264_c0_g1_i14.p3  ORF type:complete len:208 (-),score=-1.91 TRINITY_DN3264_c0_g1_i14:107-730(-)